MRLRQIAAVAATGTILLAGATAALPAWAAKTKTVQVKDDVFGPRTITANKGDKIKFVWRGSNPHNVRGMGINISTRTSGTRTATLKSGRGTIVCDIHSGMKLTVR